VTGSDTDTILMTRLIPDTDTDTDTDTDGYRYRILIPIPIIDTDTELIITPALIDTYG
jgi:hypothetical protein